MSDARPNILLIMTDQQRGDCMGLDPHSPPCLQTPNLDWLARTGTHFHHGYSECPSCIPARRSLMTGTAPAANWGRWLQGRSVAAAATPWLANCPRQVIKRR